MNGQMTLFDLVPAPDIDSLTEEEAVKMVGERIGMEFQYNALFNEWESKTGKLKLSLSYSHYNLDDNQNLFLGVSYSCGTSGGGSPCDSIDAAVKWCRNKIERYMEGEL